MLSPNFRVFKSFIWTFVIKLNSKSLKTIEKARKQLGKLSFYKYLDLKKLEHFWVLEVKLSSRVEFKFRGKSQKNSTQKLHNNFELFWVLWFWVELCIAFLHSTTALIAPISTPSRIWIRLFHCSPTYNCAIHFFDQFKINFVRSASERWKGTIWPYSYTCEENSGQKKVV